MKNLAIACLVMAVSVPAFSEMSWAQSGSRRGSTGGAVRSSSGGGSSRGISRGGSSRGRVARRNTPSPAQQAEFQRKQLEYQQKVLEQQAELAEQQYRETLYQLGVEPEGTANKKQNALAFKEAKNDFQALRDHAVDPAQLGPLTQPFRLREDSIDRELGKANWPEVFEGSEYQSLVAKIDSKIMGRELEDPEIAKQFLTELSELNAALNIAASNGDVGRTEFARARRFVTGLAHEVDLEDVE